MLQKIVPFRWENSRRVTTGNAEREWRKLHHLEANVTEAVELEIAYLGVWDTVGAMGVPSFLWVSKLFNRKYAFHDFKLSSSVASARHAIALDERRATFPDAPWDNLYELNARQPDGAVLPYQQLWFPGDHGSVGSGGDITGLSDDPCCGLRKAPSHESRCAHGFPRGRVADRRQQRTAVQHQQPEMVVHRLGHVNGDEGSCRPTTGRRGGSIRTTAMGRAGPSAPALKRVAIDLDTPAKADVPKLAFEKETASCCPLTITSIRLFGSGLHPEGARARRGMAWSGAQSGHGPALLPIRKATRAAASKP